MRPQSHRRRFLNKILTIFKRTHNSEHSKYPSELLAKYKISDKTLGIGSFAVVKQCTDVNSHEQCAVKIILKKVIEGKRHMLDSEIDVLKHVRHTHIVSMRDIYESEDAVYIVTDLCTGGELFQRIVERGTFTENIAADLVRQILQGVSYLHSQDIVHRDLKPENLLFKTPAENSELLITDFGLAKLLKNNNQVLTTACGTPGYVAPEILLAAGYGKPVDLWSVGVIMYTLLSGYTPFYGEDQTQLFDAIVRGDYQFDEEYWSEISEEAKNLIDKFLTLDPKTRITVDEALQDSWVKGLSKTGINLAPNVRKGLNNHQDLKTLVTVISFVKKLKMVDDLITDAETDVHSEVVSEDESQINFNNDKHNVQSKDKETETNIDSVTTTENKAVNNNATQIDIEGPNMTAVNTNKASVDDDCEIVTETQHGAKHDLDSAEEPMVDDQSFSVVDIAALTAHKDEDKITHYTQATASMPEALLQESVVKTTSNNPSQDDENLNALQASDSLPNRSEGNVNVKDINSNTTISTNTSIEQQKNVKENNIENKTYNNTNRNHGNNLENEMQNARISR